MKISAKRLFVPGLIEWLALSFAQRSLRNAHGAALARDWDAVEFSETIMFPFFGGRRAALTAIPIIRGRRAAKSNFFNFISGTANNLTEPCHALFRSRGVELYQHCTLRIRQVRNTTFGIPEPRTRDV